MRIHECILYRDLSEEDSRLLEDMAHLAEPHTICPELFYSCVSRLLAQAATYGFSGNLWQVFLTHILVNHENGYSKACEVTGPTEGTINKVALHDIRIFKELFDYDFSALQEKYDASAWDMVEKYEGNAEESRTYNTRVCKRICDLAKQFRGAASAEEMKDLLTEFYKEYGVGKFGLHKSFRIVDGEIVPITNITHVYFDDLVGYDIQKAKLRENTEDFLEGKNANNVLLYGDAGTGKSTCIKALANEYYDRGLRIIEVYRHQLKDLQGVIEQIKHRHYKFIIYMDDLSFEDFETEYKYLKAVIEGGLERRPDNLLIYATSNRRHLVRETVGDKSDFNTELHSSDTVQEKLSLSYRFGVSIYFGRPAPKEFREIVRVLAERSGIDMDEQTLQQKANAWELSHGGVSGRTARQFIDNLSARQE